MRSFWIMPVLALAACATAPGGPSPQPEPRAPGGRAGQILAECRLLEEAHARLSARGQAAPQDIVVGCPGREGLRDAMPLKAQSAALRVANAAQLPVPVAALAPQGPRVYRRMISRGVPESLARELAAEPIFAAAAGK